MINYPALANMFNEEGYKPDSAQIIALNAAIKKLDEAGVGLSDTARYSSVYQNIGVVKHMSNELDAAAEAYKEALRKNPADEDARYNLAVILYQKQKNDQNGGGEDQDQQNEQQEQEQQEQQEQQQNKDEKEEEQQQQQQEQQQDEKEIEEEKEKIEQMLKALMQDEKEIREKMEKAEKAKPKNLEKNW
jgi:cobalamin biosynthesis protein CobT